MEPEKTTPLFDKFWGFLPTCMRKDKVKAVGTWVRMFRPDPDLFLLDKIEAGIKRLVRTKKFQQGIVCGAVSYIEGRRWDDEIASTEFAGEDKTEQPRERPPETSCQRCQGQGIVYVTQSREYLGEMQELQSVARCVCKNASNWAETIPCISEVEQWSNYVEEAK